MSLHREQADLAELSHETLSVGPSRQDRVFEITQHVVTGSAPAGPPTRPSRWWGLIGSH
jgi:hypothetical protein